jgi:hypothetical protein
MAIYSSTIIQKVTSHFKSDPTVGVCYFYFDFNDNEKQRHENLIRSLIVQLYGQCRTMPEPLSSLFCSNGDRQPTTEELVLTLQQMLRNLSQIFIIIDALDECKEREPLLEFIERLLSWNLEKLHILATSRRERDIEGTLESLSTNQIPIQTSIVDADIRIHVCERLRNDPKLRKWPAEVQSEIEQTLSDGANGM